MNRGYTIEMLSATLPDAARPPANEATANMSFVELMSILGNVGEFVASIGVIVTLVYLATQIRESRRATESAVVWERAKAMRETALLWVTSPEASQLLHEFGPIQTEREFEAKYDEAPERGFQYLSVNRTVMQTLEASFLTSDNKQEREKVRLRVRTVLESLPGHRWTWRRMNAPGLFDPSFVIVVDEEMRRIREGDA